MYILMTGNPIDGMVCIGPFESVEDATKHGEDNFDEWLVADLLQPVYLDENDNEVKP